MTATAKTRAMASLGDRFAELAVIVVTLTGLALGWALKTGVENRSVPFTSGNVAAQIPASWLTVAPTGDEILHVADRTTRGFSTIYLIQQAAVPADMGASEFVSLLTLNRGNSLTSFRVLTQQEVLVAGRDAIQLEYVYVESDPNSTHADMPAVVHGLDYVFVANGQAVIVSFRADQSEYRLDLGRFHRFLASVSY